jgi:RNA polymerase sigma-70 factor, ECF subfamily
MIPPHVWLPDMTEARDEVTRREGEQGERRERFLQLFLANERRIYAFILALVPSWSDADDLLQETSAVMWRKWDEFAPGTDFVAWALRIARYEVLSYRRRQVRDRTLFSDRTDELLADHAEAMGRAADARRDALEACLAKLSGRDRELIRLRYQPGATTQEAAERAGRSLKAVYKALNRIHEQLLMCIRKRLTVEGLS